jgi:hypothetical protein
MAKMIQVLDALHQGIHIVKKIAEYKDNALAGHSLANFMKQWSDIGFPGGGAQRKYFEYRL